KGDNYEQWSRSIRNDFRAKNKFSFVDGTISKPTTDSNDYVQWGIVNSMMVAWIYNTLDVSIRSTVHLLDEAKMLWDDLQARYSIGNGPRILELKSLIIDSANKFTKIQESELLHQFYIGLDHKKFESALSTLLIQDPPPSVNIVYFCIIADERKQLVFEAQSVNRSTAVGFAIQTSTYDSILSSS
ncbi:Retrovirus-related Pol polyprotein from transposon RE2, partial [Bienertia sinuspersici]